MRSADLKPPSGFRTVAEVARYCGVSEKTVRRWNAAGELRVHRLGRSIRVADEDLQAFLRRQRG